MIHPIADIEELIRRQRDHFRSGATSSFEFRRNALLHLREKLLGSEEHILSALFTDFRKPPREAYAAEIGLVLTEIDYAIKHLKRWMRPSRRSAPLMTFPAKARVVRPAFGVSLILGPWNYPVQLLLLPLIGAIAGGNTAVVKPSELALRTSEAIASLIDGAFAPEHVACVQGDRSVAEALLREHFDKIFFTGGQAAGREVALAAARHLTPVTLELGGKCPVIVCADANIAVAARRIVWAKTMNAGQTCVAPDYLLVHRSIRPQLIEAMIAAQRDMFGPDVQKSPDYGRIVNPRHLHRLAGYLKDGTIISGGQVDPADLYLAPTLIDNVPPDAGVMEEEIFGPILPVLPFDELGAAIEIVTGKPPPLAVYLFTSTRSARNKVAGHIPCGGICINDLVVQIFGKQLPFGGVGASGMGRYHGKASFECFTQEQSILECSTAIDPKTRYSPPGLSMSRFKRILPWLLRG